MSIKDIFKSGLSRETEKLKKENREVHEAVIRKHKELMKIRMSMVTEACPDCGYESTMQWNVLKNGYQAFCPKCGFPMMLCGECMVDGDGFCDWNGDTGFCYRIIEGFWKNLADVPFYEDKEGRLLLEKEYRLKIGTREIATFPSGTEREEIWHWFDERYPKGVAYLLYREDAMTEERK